jgi:hypothetical protein
MNLELGAFGGTSGRPFALELATAMTLASEQTGSSLI